MKEEKSQELNQILMQFGPLHGNVERQEIHTPPTPTTSQPQEPVTVEKDYESPVCLSKERGF